MAFFSLLLQHRRPLREGVGRNSFANTLISCAMCRPLREGVGRNQTWSEQGQRMVSRPLREGVGRNDERGVSYRRRIVALYARAWV